MQGSLSRSLSDIADELDAEVGANKSFVVLRFREILREKGFYSALGQFDELFREEIRQIIDEFKAIGISQERLVSNLSFDLLDQVLQAEERALESKSESLIDDLEGRMFQSVLTGEPFDASLAQEGANSYLDNTLYTAANTERLGFSRSVQFAAAKELGLDLFLYAGPDDDITRPFCEEILNEKDPPIYTIAEIDRMDNEQGLSVNQYGGGYNCRHRWLPISETKAREMGWDG